MKIVKILLVLVIFAFAVVAVVRFASGEDSWICDKGVWVKHGSPSAPQPTTACPGSEPVEEITTGPD